MTFGQRILSEQIEALFWNAEVIFAHRDPGS
jgi:hypothetical protein